jgi:DNA-binding winged helix-turn-helix (wHTH) protein
MGSQDPQIFLTPMRLAFGECVFDTELRQLLRGGAPVHLTPKASRLLEMLIERRQRPASKRG